MTGAQCWRELPAIVCPGPRCRMKIGRRVDRIEPPKPIAENGGRVADLRGLIVLIGSTPILPDRISAMWDRTRQRAGIPNVRLHDLRHWAATTMLDAGVPLPVVTERLGHASGAATTLRVYAHSTRAADKNAADMLAGRLNPIP